MGSRPVVETGHDRKALVADAGFRRISFASVVAGVLSAYGAFAVLAGLVAGVIDALDVDIDLSERWQELGLAGALVVAALLLVAYLFGGYVAGRMARRAGSLHGVAVFVLGVIVVALAAVIARQLGGADATVENLRALGVPTTGSEWSDIATVAGIASLAAMLLGALGGGLLGERWHTKLLSRALDPRVGAQSDALRAAEERAAEAEEQRVAAGERGTAAFQRVRATAPTRTERADRADLEPDRASERDLGAERGLGADDYVEADDGVVRRKPARDANPRRVDDGPDLPPRNGTDPITRR